MGRGAQVTITERQLAGILAGIERRIREANQVEMAIERGFDTHPQGEWPGNGTETVTLRFNGGAKNRYFDV